MSGHPRPGVGSDRTHDLAWSVLDDLATRTSMGTSLRDALYLRLRASIESGEWDSAADHLAAFLDTWPLATMVDDAREKWAEGVDADALAVLARAASVVGLAQGWAVGQWGPWPIPDDSWLDQRSVSAGEPEDGAALGLVELDAVDLVRQRADICRQLVTGALAAVAVDLGQPGDEADAQLQLALGECRLEGRAQLGFDRFGYAGLHAPHGHIWPEPLTGAPEGTAGPVLRPLCDSLLLPGPIGSVRNGDIKTVGWLLWDGPYRPVAVMPEAVQVLQQLDGDRSHDEVREVIGAPADAFDIVVADLVRVGAATVAE